jgi:hypothetical protein
MFITGLCGPAIIYIGFSLIQIFIDVYNGVMNAAFLKFIIMIVFTLILNMLCNLGLSIIAWLLVFIPIIMMTVISTLLLQVFGLDSENKTLTSKNTSQTSNNDELIKAETNNSQQTNSNNSTRINRDDLRIKFYDNIDKYYDLSYNKEHKYDLSNNPIKYNIVDNLINHFSEYSFVKNIVNSNLYNRIFSNALSSNSELLNNYNNIIRQSNLEQLNSVTGYNSFNGYNSYNGFNGFNVINARDINRRPINNNTNELKYDHLNLNSYDIHKTKAYINSLNKDDKTVCPSNETPITYKSKTGLDCYEICAPGRKKDANGVCRNFNSYATF